MARLAPKMRERVEAAVAECHSAGLDVEVYETWRPDELQQMYFEDGVTHAKSALYGWHGYGLAVDFKSATHGWDVDEAYWLRVAAICKNHGLDWGGNWKTIHDTDHFQFGTLRSSPSPRARALFAQGGVEAVWKEVGAM